MIRIDSWRRNATLMGLLGTWLGSSLGGCEEPVFSCSDDGDCAYGSRAGECQPNGWCSFEDPSCPSEQRYASHSDKSLADTCVPVEGSGAPMSADTDTAEPQGSSDGPGQGGSESGETSGGHDTAEPVDPESTSEADPPPPLDTGESSSGGDTPGTGGDTTEEPPGCATLLFDGFDSEPGAAWNTWEDPGTSMNVSDSALLVTMVGEGVGGTDAGLNSVDAFDLSHGYVQIEVTSPPSGGSAMRLYLQVHGDDCQADLFVEDDDVYAFGDIGSYGADTAWLRIRSEGMLAYVEQSPDGVSWSLVVDPAPIPCSMSQAHVLVFAGVGSWNAAGPTAAVGSIEVCGA